MTDAELRAARIAMRHGGEPTREVLDALARAARAVVATGRLPNALSPEGHWEGDVPEELCQRWIAEKLLAPRSGGTGDGELASLLQKAISARAFGAMARKSFYHWLLSSRERSQASNIYGRLVAVLECNPDVFALAQDATRSQDRHWQPTGQNWPVFAGSDRELAAAAMAAGEIKILRYSANAKRLSPLISSDDLLRFAKAAMEALGRSLTPAELMRSLATRMDLGNTETVSLDDMLRPPAVEPADEAVLRDTVVAAIHLMSDRQPEILVRLARGETGQDIAKRMGVSPATVSAEKSAAYGLLSQFSENDHEMGALLNCVLDVLYGASDA